MTTLYELSDPRTGHCRYVGITDDLSLRMLRHKYSAMHQSDAGNKHKDRWLRQLYDAELSPTVSIVAEDLSREDACALEISTIAARRSAGDPLTNISPGGDGTNAGVPMAEEQKQKLRLASTGKHPSEETRKKLSNSLIGRALSADHIAAISASKKGKPHPLSAETRAKISASKLGKKHTDEARARMSAALTGRTLSEEHRAKISAFQTGRPKPRKASGG